MIGTRLILAGVAAQLALAAPAGAAEWSGCYARAYDAAHLSAHPKQKVVKITADIEPLQNADMYVASADVAFRFRGEKRRWVAVGDCSEKDGALRCGLDGDAGVIAISHAAGGLKIDVTSGVRASLPEDETTSHWVGDPEDRVFLLPSAPKSACR